MVCVGKRAGDRQRRHRWRRAWPSTCWRKRLSTATALTGKAASVDYLRGLGASEVRLRGELDLARIRPLDKPCGREAVDNLGGAVLAWIHRRHAVRRNGGQHRPRGRYRINTTVCAAALRGVSLLGIDSSQTAYALMLRAGLGASGERPAAAPSGADGASGSVRGIARRVR